MVHSDMHAHPFEMRKAPPFAEEATELVVEAVGAKVPSIVIAFVNMLQSPPCRQYSTPSTVK